MSISLARPRMLPFGRIPNPWIILRILAAIAVTALIVKNGIPFVRT